MSRGNYSLHNARCAYAARKKWENIIQIKNSFDESKFSGPRRRPSECARFDHAFILCGLPRLWEACCISRARQKRFLMAAVRETCAYLTNSQVGLNILVNINLAPKSRLSRSILAN